MFIKEPEYPAFASDVDVAAKKLKQIRYGHFSQTLYSEPQEYIYIHSCKVVTSSVAEQMQDMITICVICSCIMVLYNIQKTKQCQSGADP